ncbi:MAG: hypothetical protein FWG37_00100, partial [Clostridia bacterium]|nr:hypothetical protein [Clostridia bacterium]
MKKKNKRIALVACALMLLSLSIGAMAEAPATPYKRAMDEGKSASFTAELSWGSPSFLDEDMNKPLALAIGALSVSGFHGTLENGDRFNSVDINVNGTSVLPFDIYMTGESLVINSPLYGGAIEIAQEEVPVLLETIGQIFDEMFADQLPPDMTFTDMIDQVLTTLDEQLETVAAPELSAEASLDEAIEQFGLEDFVAALDAWAEGFTGAPYEGGDIADFGEDVAEVLIYELSRDQIVELFETLLPLVLENETFWRAVIEQQNGFVQAAMPPLEVLMAQIAEMDMVQQIIDAVPEALAFTYVE